MKNLDVLYVFLLGVAEGYLLLPEIIKFAKAILRKAQER